MKRIISLLLVLMLVFSFAACSKSEPETTPTPDATETTPAGPVAEEVKGVTIPEFSITVNDVTVDNNAMVAYPVYSVQAFSINSSGTESTVTYIGFAMSDVLAAAGLTGTYTALDATADDGYAVEFTGDVMANTTLLAISKNGEQFATSPWFAPCSSETTGDYLKNCVAITVKEAEGTQNAGGEGKVELGAPEKADKTDKVTFDAFSFKVNDKEVTNETLAGLSIYKVKVVTKNKKEELVETTYTGYVLADVLNAVEVKDFAKIKVIASDGYESELDAALAKNELTIVAIEKDGELGEGGSLWIAPCSETSAGSYSKLVVELKAE